MTRERLPTRRGSSTLAVKFANAEGLKLKAFMTYSRNGGGRISEVFVSAGKPGSPNEAMLRDVGLLLSLALQHGATIQEVREALTRSPSPTRPDDPGSQVGVIVDALAKEDEDESSKASEHGPTDAA